MQLFHKNSHHYLVIIGILSLGIAAFITYTSFNPLRHRPFPRPRENNVSLIQGWMTLDHISHVYLVPQDELEKRLDVDFDAYKKSSLNKIAKKTGKNSAEFIKEVQQAVIDFQTSHPKPPDF
ncbi:hypothetical protein BH09PAT2_BH09PAT2_05830 [soil metagenome]